MSKDKDPEDTTLEMQRNCYKIFIKNNVLYLRFGPSILREDVLELDLIIKDIKEHQGKIRHAVFDLVDLKKFDLRCCRTFALAQHEARSHCLVVTIQPEALAIKKIMLDQGIIRPKEICDSRKRLFDFIKYLERQNDKDETT